MRLWTARSPPPDCGTAPWSIFAAPWKSRLRAAHTVAITRTQETKSAHLTPPSRKQTNKQTNSWQGVGPNKTQFSGPARHSGCHTSPSDLRRTEPPRVRRRRRVARAAPPMAQLHPSSRPRPRQVPQLVHHAQPYGQASESQLQFSCERRPRKSTAARARAACRTRRVPGGAARESVAFKHDHLPGANTGRHEKKREGGPAAQHRQSQPAAGRTSRQVRRSTSPTLIRDAQFATRHAAVMAFVGQRRRRSQMRELAVRPGARVTLWRARARARLAAPAHVRQVVRDGRANDAAPDHDLQPQSRR